MNLFLRNIRFRYTLCFVLVWLSLSAIQAQNVIGVSSDSSKIAQQQHLKDVEVKAYRPLMKVGDDGGMIYDAEQLAKNRPIANAFDLLEEIPGLVKDGEDAVTIAGCASSMIIINGRKQRMSISELNNLLCSMSPTQVKSIEVYQVAPPYYGVKGGVINIVLHKKRSEKLRNSGSAWTSLYQGKKYYQTGGADWNLFQKKWMLDAGFSLGFREGQKRNELSSHHVLGDKAYDINNVEKRYSHSAAYKVSGRFNYDFSKEQNIEVSYLYRYDKPKYTSLSPLWQDDELLSKSESEFDGVKHSHIFQVDYIYKKWKIGGNYVRFVEDNNQNMVNDMASEAGRLLDNGVLSSLATQKISSESFYMNHFFSIGKVVLNYGIDLSFYSVDNFYSNVWANSPSHDNEINYNKQKEQDHSAFVSWSQKMGRMSLSANLLLSYYYARLVNNSQKSTLWNRFAFLPSLSANYKITDRQRLMFSLSSNCVYPNYGITNGRRAYYNDYIYIGGKVDIQPYMQYDIQLNYVLNSRYIFGIYSTLQPKRFLQLFYQDPQKLVAGYEHFNMDENNLYGLKVVAPKQWSARWQTKLTALAFYRRLTGSFNHIKFDKGRVTCRLLAINNVVLDKRKTFSVQLMTTYTAITQAAYAEDAALFNTSLSLTWNPYKAHWQLILKATDLFDTYHNKRKVDYESQHYIFKAEKDLRMLNLTIRYSFNGYKQKKRQEVDTSRMGL